MLIESRLIACPKTANPTRCGTYAKRLQAVARVSVVRFSLDVDFYYSASSENFQPLTIVSYGVITQSTGQIPPIILEATSLLLALLNYACISAARHALLINCQ